MYHYANTPSACTLYFYKTRQWEGWFSSANITNSRSHSCYTNDFYRKFSVKPKTFHNLRMQIEILHPSCPRSIVAVTRTYLSKHASVNLYQTSIFRIIHLSTSGRSAAKGAYYRNFNLYLRWVNAVFIVIWKKYLSKTDLIWRKYKDHIPSSDNFMYDTLPKWKKLESIDFFCL